MPRVSFILLPGVTHFFHGPKRLYFQTFSYLPNQYIRADVKHNDVSCVMIKSVTVGEYTVTWSQWIRTEDPTP